MATHSSILDCESLRTEEPGGLQSRGVTKSRIQLSTHAPSLGPSLQIILRRPTISSLQLNGFPLTLSMVCDFLQSLSSFSAGLTNILVFQAFF